MASDTFEVPIQSPDDWRFDDVEAAAILPGRKPDLTARRALFSTAELRKLDLRRAARGPQALPRTVVFLSYENRWARSGGIAAVAAMLPSELARAGAQVLRLSPRHSALKTAPAPAELEAVGECPVKFAGATVPVSIYLASENDRRWCLFGAPGFFEADGGAGGSDPYVFSDESRADRDGDDSRLLRDSLFAAKAAPAVLAILAARRIVTSNLVVHAQDWELAAVALTVKEAQLEGTLPGAASVVLTLHNPYDHGLSDAALARITRRWQPERWPLIGSANRTVLARMIPLADSAISTVSRRFAQELTTDPLQTGHFARHYQAILARQGVIGIDNGLFASPPDPDPAFDRIVELAGEGQVEPILERKQAARAEALRRLEHYLVHLKAAPHHDSLIFGDLDGGGGRPLADLPNGVPIFFMTGRLDPGQKGFDVFAGAIDQLPVGLGRYILSPLSPLAFDPETGLQLDYLKELARSRPGEVVVLPFRLTDIYLALLQGVTWSVWPSLYEPFGGVTEPYLALTPVIARATGGLVQQVASHDVSPAQATGILYRERVPPWRGWQEEEQRAMQQVIDPRLRRQTLLFGGQASALAEALLAGAELYRDHRPKYGRLLANLPAMCQRLDWQRSVDDYRLWYDSACREAGP